MEKKTVIVIIAGNLEVVSENNEKRQIYDTFGKSEMRLSKYILKNSLKQQIKLDQIKNLKSVEC